MDDDQINLIIKRQGRKETIDLTSSKVMYAVESDRGREIHITRPSIFGGNPPTGTNTRILTSSSEYNKCIKPIPKESNPQESPHLKIMLENDNTVKIEPNNLDSSVSVAGRQTMNGSISIDGEDFDDFTVEVGDPRYEFEIDMKSDEENVDVEGVTDGLAEEDLNEDDSEIDENTAEFVIKSLRRYYRRAPALEENMLASEMPTVKEYRQILNHSLNVTDSDVIAIHNGKQFKVEDLKDILEDIENNVEIVNNFEVNEARNVNELQDWEQKYKDEITNRFELSKKIGKFLYVYKDSYNSMTVIDDVKPKVNPHLKDDEEEEEEEENKLTN